MTPTQRTLAKLRADGYVAEVVERFNHFARVRVDLFGFIDVLAVKPGEVLAVQCTARSSMASRVKKILTHENFKRVTRAGIAVEVWGWGKLKRSRKVELRRVRV